MLKKTYFNFIHTRRFEILSTSLIVRTMQFVLVHPLFDSERVDDFFPEKFEAA